MRLLRLFAVGFVTTSVCALVIGQGGQGGGFGGGGGRAMATGDEGVYTQILTPGDKGEWPIDVKAGETILATARSSVFDAALEIVDYQNKVLASNDDIEPGNQTARLIYRFEKAGEYRVWVKGFKSASGGQFTLNLRRFSPSDSSLGKKNSFILDSTGVVWLRFRGEKGKPMSLFVDSQSGAISAEMFDPTGGDVEFESTDRGRGTRYDLRDINEGDYFLRLRGVSNAGISFTPTLIPIHRMKLGQTLKGQLPSNGIEIAMLTLEDGELAWVSIKGKGPVPWITSGALDVTSTLKDAWQVLYNMQTGGYEVIYASKKTDVALTLAQPSGLPTDYEVSISSALRPMTQDRTSSNITVGGAEILSFDGKRGDLLKLEARSNSFASTVTLFGPDGAQVARGDQGRDLASSSLTALLPTDGRYFTIVHSRGLGGSGAYELTKSLIAPKTIAPGETKSSAIASGGVEVWKFRGKAGQRVLLSAAASSADLAVSVLGTSGERIGKSESGGLSILTLAEDGEYSIWISASDGSGAYRIRLIDID